MPEKKKPRGKNLQPEKGEFRPNEDGQPGEPAEAGPRGLIFDIQGHSVHDGPGTRTTVFLSGCPLQCVWCCNPEGLFHQPVVLQRATKCVRCGNCAAACPYGAISFEPGRPPVLDRSWCDTCRTYDCVEGCFHEALTISGKYYGVDDLMRIFHRDRQFWGSRGGVTFSGGEPLLQREFIRAILARCKEASIHTCIETTACLAHDYFRSVLPYVDWVFVDIKHMDPATHKELTGVDNHLILKNIQLLAADDWPGFPVVRIPVIPGINDDEANIQATARWVREQGLEVINILPFHRLGESKYRQIGRTYRFEEMAPPPETLMSRVKRQIEAEGVVCYVGYKTPF